MKHLDLFSGIGGFALAAQLNNIQTVAFCEIDSFAKKVLSKNFPNIPIHNDINELNGDKYYGIDIITGGYPCQPFSVAGNQKADKDDRNLWPQMFRIIKQARPTWVVCENVDGHIKLGLDKVLSDLENQGYTTRTFNVSALSVGANHNRKRIWIVAYSTSNGFNASTITGSNDQTNDKRTQGSQENSDNERCRCIWSLLEWGSNKTRAGRTEPPPLRVDDGLPNRMDRNKSLGNAIVPEIAYKIFNAITRTQS